MCKERGTIRIKTWASLRIDIHPGALGVRMQNSATAYYFIAAANMQDSFMCDSPRVKMT